MVTVFAADHRRAKPAQATAVTGTIPVRDGVARQTERSRLLDMA
jgi:hypothetical protein